MKNTFRRILTRFFRITISAKPRLKESLPLERYLLSWPNWLRYCNIERFYVRDKQAIQNHFFCALRAFAKLQTLRINDLIDNLYQISRQLFVPVIRQFILEHHDNMAFS